MSSTDPEREDTDARLARLARETERVGPRGGFNARVMSRIAAVPAFLDDMIRVAKRFVPVAFVAAAAALVWAVRSEPLVDEAVAFADVDADDAAEEIDW